MEGAPVFFTRLRVVLTHVCSAEANQFDTSKAAAELQSGGQLARALNTDATEGEPTDATAMKPMGDLDWGAPDSREPGAEPMKMR